MESGGLSAQSGPILVVYMCSLCAWWLRPAEPISNAAMLVSLVISLALFIHIVWRSRAFEVSVARRPGQVLGPRSP